MLASPIRAMAMAILLRRKMKMKRQITKMVTVMMKNTSQVVSSSARWLNSRVNAISISDISLMVALLLSRSVRYLLRV